MTPAKSYNLYCALSGLMWAGIGLCIGHIVMWPFIWGGVIASPLIGLAAGHMFKSFARWPRLIRVVASLLMLYLAVAALLCDVGVLQTWNIETKKAPTVKTAEALKWAIQGSNTPQKTREKPCIQNTGAAKSAADADHAGLADTIRAIMALPLTDTEKADAVRRLLGTDPGR